MKINRRQALGIIGLSVTTPKLLIQNFSIPKRSFPNSIPTGIPTLDHWIGNLRKGSLNSIVGSHGSGKSTLAKTIALNASNFASVAMITEDQYDPCNHNYTLLERNIALYTRDDLTLIPYLTEMYDLVVIDAPLIYKIKDLLNMRKTIDQKISQILKYTLKNESSIVLTYCFRNIGIPSDVPNRSILYTSSNIVQLHYSPKNAFQIVTNSKKHFTLIELIKSRYSKNSGKPIILETTPHHLFKEFQHTERKIYEN